MVQVYILEVKFHDVVMRCVFCSLYLCSYPCEWGGVTDGKAYVKALEDFAKAVLEDLWSVIQKLFVEVRHPNNMKNTKNQTVI